MCDAHDHLFFGSRQLPGQELRSVSAARAELTAFAAQGGGAVVQWTPYGLGRRADELAGAVPGDRGADRRRDRAAPGRPLRRRHARRAARAAGRRVRHRTDRGHRAVGGPCGADQGGGRLPRARRARPLDDDRGGGGASCDGGADRRPPGAGDRCTGRTGAAVRGVGGAAAASDPRTPQPLPRLHGTPPGRGVGLLSRLRRSLPREPRHGLAHARRGAGARGRGVRRPTAARRRHHDRGGALGQRRPGDAVSAAPGAAAARGRPG